MNWSDNVGCVLIDCLATAAAWRNSLRGLAQVGIGFVTRKADKGTVSRGFARRHELCSMRAHESHTTKLRNLDRHEHGPRRVRQIRRCRFR